MLTRRNALLAGLAFTAATSATSLARATAPLHRTLRFHNLHTGETLDAEYWTNGTYAPDALSAINHILRDHRTGESTGIDTRLLDLLSDLSGQLETRAPFQIISGYRSPATNAALADASNGVARRSLHVEGKAIDVAIEGVDTENIQQAALAMARGGVGHYPNPGFVHVDVGRVRRW